MNQEIIQFNREFAVGVEVSFTGIDYQRSRKAPSFR